MNINEKYNFKVSMDQFGGSRSDNWYDPDEVILIEQFELACLNLPKKEQYIMIELGANQAYYSLLFKSILGSSVTTNIMVEPYEPYIPRSKHEFNLNGYDGIFIEKGIGTHCQIWGHDFNKPTTSIDELLNEFQITNLDVLHCDIDGAEFLMLEGAHHSFNKKLIDYAFILTHYGLDKHESFKEKMKTYDYQLIFDESNPLIGSDRLLIYKRSN